MGVGDHVPTRGIRAEAFEGLEGVDGIAQALGHFLPVLVENQAIGHHRLVGHAIKDHGGNGVEGVEPTAGLVHAFRDEIRRIRGASRPVGCAFDALPVLERVVPLRVRHAAGVEPDVDEVGFTVHRTAVGRLEDDAIHDVLVQVDVGVVGIRHVTRREFRERVGCHQPPLHGFRARVEQFLHGADAPRLAAVLRPPDGNGNAPVARTAQVPVVQVLEPFAETTRSRGGRLPLDGRVERLHALLGRRRPDEPAVQRVVKHRAVCPPAVRITVLVLLDEEGPSSGLQVDGDLHIDRLLRCIAVVVFLLHEAAGHRTALGAETALQVHKRHTVALAIVHEQGWHAGGLRDPGVVRTEGGGRVHDARSVLRGHEVTRNDAEGLLRRFHRQGPIDELLVAKAHQVGALYGGEHLGIRRLLAAEVLSVERLGQHHDPRLPRVAVGGLDDMVGNVRTDGEGGVGRQGPGRGRPCQEVDRQSCRSLTGHAAKALGAVLE